MLRPLQRKCFINDIKIFGFDDALYVVTEYMAVSLVQILAAPVYPDENQVAAIVGQVGFPDY